MYSCKNYSIESNRARTPRTDPRLLGLRAPISRKGSGSTTTYKALKPGKTLKHCLMEKGWKSTLKPFSQHSNERSKSHTRPPLLDT